MIELYCVKDDTKPFGVLVVRALIRRRVWGFPAFFSNFSELSRSLMIVKNNYCGVLRSWMFNHIIPYCPIIRAKNCQNGSH